MKSKDPYLASAAAASSHKVVGSPCASWHGTRSITAPACRSRGPSTLTFRFANCSAALRATIDRDADDKSSASRLLAREFGSAATLQRSRPGQISFHVPRSQGCARSAFSIAARAASVFEYSSCIEYGGSRKTKSRTRPPSSICRMAFPASSLAIWKPLVIPSDFQIRGNYFRGSFRRLDEVHHPRAAAQSFDSHRAGSCIQIKPGCLRQRRRISSRQHIEQGLAQPVRRRTDFKPR